MFLRWGGAICLVLVAGISATLYWRVSLANAALEFALQRAGISTADVKITALSTSQIRFAHIRLGNAIDIENVDAVFDLSRLSGNPVRRITVDALRADLDGARRELEKLPIGETTGGQTSTVQSLLEQVPAYPDITVRKFALRHEAAERVVSAIGSLAAGGNGRGIYGGRVSAALSTHLNGETHAAAIEGTARLAPQAVTAEFTAKVDDGSLLGSLSARGDISADRVLLGGGIRLEAHDIGRLAAFVPGMKDTAGAATLNIGTTSPLAFDLDAPLSLSALTTALRKAGSDGIHADAVIRNGSHNRLYRGVNGTLAVTVRGGEDSVQAGGTISLRAKQAGTAAVNGGDASLDGRIEVRRDDGVLALAFPGGLRATAAQIAYADGSVVAAPVKMTLNAEHARILTVSDGTSRRADLHLRLDTGATTLSLGGTPERTRIDVSPVALQLTGTIDDTGGIDARIQAPGVSVGQKTKSAAFDDFDLAIRQTRRGVTGDMRGRVSLRDGDKPLLLPTPLETGFALRDKTVNFNAKAVLPDTSVASARGRHDLATGRGNAVLAVPGFRITRGGNEIQGLTPSLSGPGSAIDILSGSVRADARLVWDKKGMDGTGAIRLDNVDFAEASSGATVQGLSADIRLNRILPPRTPPDQTVRVKRIGAGISLNDLFLKFALIDGAATAIPAVRIGQFQSGFAGGTLSIAPTVLDSEAAGSQATINVAQVDLAALLSAVGLDGISGTGRLSGVIPVEIAGNAVGISGGRLAAAGPGVLRIRSEAAKRALAKGGEEVALMLSALENFRYEELTLEIEKETAGEGRVLLRTQGLNPEVRDGQPFVINLTLTGNVDGLAAVLAQALQLPGGIVRTMLAR